MIDCCPLPRVAIVGFCFCLTIGLTVVCQSLCTYDWLLSITTSSSIRQGVTCDLSYPYSCVIDCWLMVSFWAAGLPCLIWANSERVFCYCGAGFLDLSKSAIALSWVTLMSVVNTNLGILSCLMALSVWLITVVDLWVQYLWSQQTLTSDSLRVSMLVSVVIPLVDKLRELSKMLQVREQGCQKTI